MHLRHPPGGGRGLSGVRRVALAVSGAVLLLAAGCRQPSDAPEISLRWTAQPQPLTTGPMTLSLELSDSQRPVTGAEVRLEGTMTHPGMAPVQAPAAEVSPGRYVGRLDLSMAGDWVLLVDARLRDGRILHRQIELPGVRPGG
ncbi:MAG: FixH family protein [Acidobacteriota bacterium]